MTSLVSDIFDLRPDEAISANMALETPQTVIRWRLSSSLPEVDLVSIRRSLFRFPEELSEGDVLIDEVPTDQSSIRTSYSDTAVEAFKVYYYSVFFTHKGPFSMDLNFSLDIQRLGIIRGVFTKSAFDEYWILAREEGGDPSIWSYDSNKQLVEERIDLSNIISEVEERVVSIVSFVDSPPNREFQIVTDRRFIEFTIAATAEEVTLSDITNEFNFLGVITPGFEIRGGTKIAANFAVLDIENEEVTLLNTSGAVINSMDLSALELDGNYLGISRDSVNSRLLLGSGKVIYGVDENLAAPTNLDIDSLHPVRQGINSDFYYDSTLGVLLLPDDNLDVIERYAFSDLSGQTQIEEAAIPGPGIVGLWKLDESTGAVVDSSGEGNDGVIVGSPTRGSTGKFSNAIDLLVVGDSVDIVAAASDFDPDDGFVKFWYTPPYEGFAVSAAVKTFEIFVDASNLVRMELGTDGSLTVTMTRSGTPNTISIPAFSSFDNGLYHSYEVRWVGGAGGLLELIVDGVCVGTSAIAGAWVGTPTVMHIGGDSSNSALGSYDDFVLGAGVFASFVRYQLVTRGNRSHALSGRDYDEDGQHWRDKLRLEFGEYILRNDFREIVLPQDKSLTDEEVIFRQTAEELNIGELSRLARMFGLFLDRSTDRRKFFMNHLTARAVEFEFIDKLGEIVNAGDVDPDWNVDVRRRFLEVMYYAFQRGGTLDAFKRLTRHLGFRLLCPDDVVGTLVSVARRFFDSVVDPDRPDVHFDTSFFDSFQGDVQFVTVNLKFYKENFSSIAGVTSIPASRLLDDITANFTQDAEVGSLIIINDQDSVGDNGQYLITAINSGTQVVVDRDWPAGSLGTLDYRLHWRVPPSDPFNDQIISRLTAIKARWQDLAVVL